MKKFHENIKKLLLNELNTKIYFMKNTDEAMDLLNRKKYNKLLLSKTEIMERKSL